MKTAVMAMLLATLSINAWAQAEPTDKQKAADKAARAEQKTAIDHATGKASEKDAREAREKADKAAKEAKDEKDAREAKK